MPKGGIKMRPIDLLKEYDVEFSWISKETLAQLFPKEKKVKINLEGMLAYVFTHEFLHQQHPLMEEEEIIARTERYYNRMTKQEIVILANAIKKRR